MILLLFGPPGCGKGTQGVRLAEKFQIPVISTGEIFRAECKAGTELGRMACSILSKGGLVGDEIVNGIVAGRLARPDCANGFLLDGYPRTLAQARQLTQLLEERGLPKPVVIHLDVPDSVLIARLTARRQCPQCLRIYNTLSQRPQTEGKCDHDGADLITREDDQESVIRERLHAYEEVTGPILKFYGESMVRRVDGRAGAQAVGEAVEEAVMAPGTGTALEFSRSE